MAAQPVPFFQMLQIGEALGIKSAKFPKGRDPETALPAKYSHLRIVQTEDSTLTKEALFDGLEDMLSKVRERWLDDIDSGAFKIVMAPRC